MVIAWLHNAYTLYHSDVVGIGVTCQMLDLVWFGFMAYQPL